MGKNKINFKAIMLWTLRTLVRASIVIIGYTLFIIIVVAEWTLFAVAWIGKYFDVNIKGLQSEKEMDFTQKYSEDEISSMADKITDDLTIKDIESMLGVSYRQARKIKESAKHSPTINNYRCDEQMADIPA